MTGTIECDLCGTSIDYECEDAEDAEDSWGRDYGATDVEVTSPLGGSVTYYDHLCESCNTDELLYCDHCAITVVREDGYYCDESLCDNCVEEVHEEWREDDPDTFYEGIECINCGFEFSGPTVDFYSNKPLVSL